MLIANLSTGLHAARIGLDRFVEGGADFSEVRDEGELFGDVGFWPWMRHTKVVFCRPVNALCRPPARPAARRCGNGAPLFPLVGVSMPPISLSNVDLPSPFAPRRPTLRCAGMSSVMP